MTIPNEPFERLLSRHLGRVANRDFTDALDEAMTALVNYMTWVFARCWETSKKDREDTVVMLLFRHIIESTDATHILLLNLATRPAQIVVRSMFEGLLYLEFVLESDWKSRARTYEVGSRIWSIRHSKRLEEGSQARKQYATELRSDPLVSEEMLESWSVDSEDIGRSETYLEQSDLSEEYQAYKRSGLRSHWYSVVDPKLGNLRELALHLDRGGQYFLYDVWSRNVHPDLIGAQLELGDRRAWMRLLRDGEGVAMLANVIAMLARDAIVCVTDHYRADERARIEQELATEISPLFARLEDARSPNSGGGVG